jgi:hypothetical protein
MNKQITKQERINRLKKENRTLQDQLIWKQALLNHTIKIMENHVEEMGIINEQYGRKEYEIQKGMMK